MQPLVPLARVEGALTVPGDKSVSHRALLFAAVAEGQTEITGLSSAADVQSTAMALRALGIQVELDASTALVTGKGWEAFSDVQCEALACDNAGTLARLVLGLLSGQPRGKVTLVGDASLSGRPMGRVVRPLATLGADIRGGDRLPLTVHGRQLTACDVATEVPSAQVKSALLLAALQAEGNTRIGEGTPTRDHSERMLVAMGAGIARSDGNSLLVTGGRRPLTAIPVQVAGDPSSAAFFVTLAAALPGSALRVENVLLNPRRIGFLTILKRMGADLRWTLTRESPEPIGDITVHGGPLVGTDISGADVADAIDELPVLAVVATQAAGTTRISDARELRVKETDRIEATAVLIRGLGGNCTVRDDGLTIVGPQRLPGGRLLHSAGDHRIAMAAAVGAAFADAPASLQGERWVTVSFPDFFEHLRAIGRPR